MINVVNAAEDIAKVFHNDAFSLEEWKTYISKYFPNDADLFINDMKQMIEDGGYSLDRDFLPLLNNVWKDEESRLHAINTYCTVTKNLDDKIKKSFGKSIDVTIVLYLGLCNGAGWALELDAKPYILLGIEKILELGWFDINSMPGLVFHELGHMYQKQYGILERKFNSYKKKYLWQLFTEGIAMHFEQMVVGDDQYFHQDKNGWKEWMDNHFVPIKKDYSIDLNSMNPSNQRYFGDWVTYDGFGDAGYYLGAKFIDYLLKNYSFDDLLKMNIDAVSNEFDSFVQNN